MLDCMIIGKGPAGISAAVYCARAGLATVVIGKDTGALERAEAIGNYYGFAEPLTGAELAARGIRQAESVGVEVVTAEALAIEAGETFRVKTDAGEYEARCVLLATGRTRKAPPIPGLDTLRGRGVSFCAVCDGFLYRGKRLGVIGGGAYALEEYETLRRFSPDVTVFTNGVPVEAVFPDGCKVVTAPLRAIEGTDAVERVVTEDGAYPLDGVFVAIGTAGASAFAATLGVFEENGSIVVDDGMATNVPGLFAAGDCVGGLLQVAKAVSDGARAASGMIRFVKSASKRLPPQ